MTALEELASGYRKLVEVGIKAFPLVSQQGEPSEQYQARNQEAQFPQPHRGRPREFAADVLVDQCRDMLLTHGCDFAACHDHIFESPLVSLSILVHELSGLPPGSGWRKRAENASDAVWRLKLRFGTQFDATGATPDWKKMMNRAEVRPKKRKVDL